MRVNNKWKGSQRVADSKWEAKLRDGVLSSCEHHPDEEIPYSMPHHYEPDFVYTSQTRGGQLRSVYIEAKGRFIESSEARKYLYIRDVLVARGCEFIFLFYNPENSMPQAKRRKDGTKRTMREWADSNNFKWYTEQTIGEALYG